MKKTFEKACYKSDLRYTIHSVSGTDISKAYPVNLHYDTDLTIAYFKNARGSIRIEGNHYAIESGDIFLLNYAELHCLDLQEGPAERITLYVNEQMYQDHPIDTKRLFAAFYNRPLGLSNRIPAATAKNNSLDILTEEILMLTAKQDIVSALIAFGKITDLLVRLNHLVIRDDSASDNISTNHATINQILEYANTHFAEPLSCKDIAKAVNISKFHLERIFKEHVGVSLWNYIISRRLLCFNDLVRQGISIEDACFQSGFNNYSNFYRIYKSRTGMTPRQFKKHASESSEI